MQVGLISRSRRRTPAPNGRECGTSSEVNVRLCALCCEARKTCRNRPVGLLRTQSRAIQESCTFHRHLAFPDGRILESFIGRYGFATLITSSSAGLVASHIPIMLRKRGERIPDRSRRSCKQSLARTVRWQSGGARDLSRTPCICFTVLVRDVSRGADVELRCGPRLRQGDCLRRSQLHQGSAHGTRCEI